MKLPLYEDLFDLMAFVAEFKTVPVNLCRVLHNFDKAYPKIIYQYQPT